MSVALNEGPVTVTVPATSANLGPGFDSLGLALELRDEVTAVVTDEPGVRVQVQGEGAGNLPTDQNHLVASTTLRALGDIGVEVTGLNLSAVNRIPHGRGLGSSAAAIVAGISIARALTGGSQSPIDDQRALDLAVEIEGHPDNVAPALLGSFTVSWASKSAARAVSLSVHPMVKAIVCIPSLELSTSKARALLPESVPHSDAAHNAGRTALLVHALTQDPSLLFEATEDLLHQGYRAAAMPQTIALVGALRGKGIAAVVSGAGPSVLVLSDHDVEPMTRAVAGDDFEVVALAISPTGAITL
jgi:homoserine kinase